MRANILGALALVLSATASPAAGFRDGMAGVGARSCALILDATTDKTSWSGNEENFAIMQWAQGFLSGWNVVRMGNRMDFKDPQSITPDEFWARIIGTCRRTPKMPFSLAVITAMQDMASGRYVKPEVQK